MAAILKNRENSPKTKHFLCIMGISRIQGNIFSVGNISNLTDYQMRNISWAAKFSHSIFPKYQIFPELKIFPMKYFPNRKYFHWNERTLKNNIYFRKKVLSPIFLFLSNFFSCCASLAQSFLSEAIYKPAIFILFLVTFSKGPLKLIATFRFL